MKITLTNKEVEAVMIEGNALSKMISEIEPSFNEEIFKKENLKSEKFQTSETIYDKKKGTFTIDVKEEFFIDLLLCCMKIYEKCLPVVSFVKGIIPMIKNLVGNVNADIEALTNKWEEKYEYAIIPIANDFYDDTRAIISHRIYDDKWEFTKCFHYKNRKENAPKLDYSIEYDLMKSLCEAEIKKLSGITSEYEIFDSFEKAKEKLV